MADNNNNHSKQNQRKDLIPFGGGGLLGRMDEFFSSEPFGGILESIDSFFQNHPFASAFPVDLYETDSHWVVKANIPGVRKEDIHIETLGDRLRIAVINDQDTKENNETYNYYRRERRMQRAERIIQLPYSVSRQNTKARYNNGILEVRGPKYPRTKNTLDIE